jgi:hypothetical protein
MDFTAMPDTELVATWMDLRQQVEAPTTDGDVPDESVRLLTDFNAASKERERRRIPPVDDRGSRYEVVQGDKPERFERRGDAITRAIEIGEANRASGDSAG